MKIVDTPSPGNDREIHSSNYRPLTLEQLGVEENDVEFFCQEAEEWLGLVIDPADVRNSSLDGRYSNKPPLSRYNLEQYADQDPYLAKLNDPTRYLLMMRLFRAVAIQEFLNSGILDDSNFIQTANQIASEQATDDETAQGIIYLFRTLKPFFDSYRRETRNMLAEVPKVVIKPDDEQTEFDEMKEPSDFSSKLANNIGHDLVHIIPIRFLEKISYLVVNYTTTAERVREKQDEFRKLWNEGKIFLFGKKALRAYQEECIPGWDDSQAQIVILLEEIAETICHRFGYTMVTSRYQQAPQSNVQGSGIVELRTQLSPEEIVPISEGVIVRILYNIIKNTIKAFDTQPKAVKQEQEKLHIEIELIYLKGNLILTVKDNGQGFDLNVPLPAIRQLLIDDPDTLDVIRQELSPHAANILKQYIFDNKPFAIYPLTLEELFMLFLHRKLSGGLVSTQAGDVTSGIGLNSVRTMLRGSYKGDIFISNHPAGGAYTLICIPIQPGAVDARRIIEEF